MVGQWYGAAIRQDAMLTLACHSAGIFDRLARLFDDLLNRVVHLVTVACLWFLDGLAGPVPETPTDRAIREEGERLRWTVATTRGGTR